MLPAFVTPIKPPSDTRDYRSTVLSNGTKLLIVHDPKAELSACSISVGIGSLANPNTSLGLAHFLEHMLFMGSAKYPGHNENSEFISQNGGHDNAFTTDEQTNYYFDVKSDKFVEAVDRMAEFFKSASLNPDCAEKQRQAVHQEYMLWTGDDSCRRLAVLQLLGNGQYSRFSIGNQQTLNHPKIIEQLRKFYDSYYGSRIITAVLLSDRPTEEIYESVAPILASIPDRKVTIPEFQQPYLPKQLGKMVYIQSIKNQYTLSFTFVVEPLKKLYKKHLQHYLAYVLGHEGENSLLSFLQAHGLAMQLAAGPSHIKHATLININITLTEQGYAHYKDVYDITMKYLAQLKPDPKIYNDLQEISRLEFQFRQQQQNSSYVSKLAEAMHHYPFEELLNAETIFEQFDEARLKKLIDCLNPTRLLLTLSSNNPIRNGQQEKYLGAVYKVEGLPVLSKKPLPKLVIKPNPFLPVATAIHSQPYSWPKKIAANVILQTPTERYPTCKGNATLLVSSSLPNVYQEVYASWLYSMMKLKFYDAVLLGVQFEYSYDGVLHFSHYGYNHTVMRVLQFLAEDIQTLMLDKEKAEGIFFMAHEGMMQSLQNFYFEQPLQVSTELQKRLFEGKSSTSIEQDLKLLEKLDFNEFQKVAREVWWRSRLEWVFVGNFLEAEVLNRVQHFHQLMKLKAEVPPAPVGCLKLTKDLRYEVLIQSEEIRTSTAVLCLQLGEDSFFNLLIGSIIKLYSREPFFDELRTRRQLAYNVQTQLRNNRGIFNIVFSVVSSTTNPKEVAAIMRQFIADHFEKIRSLAEQEFNGLKQAVAAKLSEPIESLEVWAAEVCRQVTHRLFQFNRTKPQLVNEVIAHITKQDVENAMKIMLKGVCELCVIANCHAQDHAIACSKRQQKALPFAEHKTSSEYSPDLMNIALSMYSQQQLDMVIAKNATAYLPH